MGGILKNGGNMPEYAPPLPETSTKLNVTNDYHGDDDDESVCTCLMVFNSSL